MRQRAASDHGQHTAPEDDAKRLERQLARLEQSVQKFRIDSQRFLAGDLPLPPDELRDKIRLELRYLRGSKLKGAAASFRLGNLEARFNSLLDLYGRRSREREERRTLLTERAARERPDPEHGVVVGRGGDESAVEALYKGLYLREGRRNPKMDLEQFRAYLTRQSEAIRAKTGCRAIQFRVAQESGKLKLKARPIKAPN